jgi:hypothetical protein
MPRVIMSRGSRRPGVGRVRGVRHGYPGRRASFFFNRTDDPRFQAAGARARELRWPRRRHGPGPGHEQPARAAESIGQLARGRARSHCPDCEFAAGRLHQTGTHNLGSRHDECHLRRFRRCLRSATQRGCRRPVRSARRPLADCDADLPTDEVRRRSFAAGCACEAWRACARGDRAAWSAAIASVHACGESAG